MNISGTTKGFLLVVLAGTTYISWTIPWKAVMWARAVCLPPCSWASRCHPLCLPPLPPATAKRGTACAKNNDPLSRAAQALPVPQSCSASCISPVDLRISAMLFINCSIINQTQSLAALNEQPVSSAPTATSPLSSQLPCFITHHNTGACIQLLLIIAARGAFQMISSHRESRYSSCQTGRKGGISIQVNASFLPIIPPATCLKSCSHSETKYCAVPCFLTSSYPCHPSFKSLFCQVAFSHFLSLHLVPASSFAFLFFTFQYLFLMLPSCTHSLLLLLPFSPILSHKQQICANKITLCCFHEQKEKRNLDSRSPLAQIYQI